MFRDTFLDFSSAGVTVGDPVLRTGKPLSVELGPGKFPLDKYVKYMILPEL